ncbi:MAG: hypothetical protein ACRC9V_00470 [Aeromonas sp.]
MALQIEANSQILRIDKRPLSIEPSNPALRQYYYLGCSLIAEGASYFGLGNIDNALPKTQRSPITAR